MRQRSEGVRVQALYSAYDCGVIAAALYIVARNFHDFVDERVARWGDGGEGKGEGRVRERFDGRYSVLLGWRWSGLLLLWKLVVEFLLLLLLMMMLMFPLLLHNGCPPVSFCGNFRIVLLIVQPPARFPQRKFVYVVLAICWFVPEE